MNLRGYLEKYEEIQDDILLCFRPSKQGVGSSWGDRCYFRKEGYSDRKAYNHRIILDKEIVIEFDEGDKDLNRRLAEEVVKRLKKDKIKYAMWFSGSVSTHVHFFINPRKATNINLLKGIIIRHYTRDLGFKADTQMAGSHLIRAEYGLNEKTGNYKSIITKSPGYPFLCEVQPTVWDAYIKSMSWLVKGSMTRQVNNLADSDIIKQLLDTTYFTDNLGDGRNRILFVLANVLKSKYPKRELVELLQKWYKYTGGVKMTDGQIAYQVYKAYSSDQCPGRGYIERLIEDIKK